MLTIDRTTARRYILGKQGLWPGRRWRGAAGTEQAMRAMEYLQLDPPKSWHAARTSPVRPGAGIRAGALGAAHV